MNTLLQMGMKISLRVWTGLVLAIVLGGATLALRGVPASADTQYAGDIQGDTHLSCYDPPWGYECVWGQTLVRTGVKWHYIREELHPQHYFLGWQTDPTQVVTDFTNKAYTRSNPTHYMAARGWSWHKDWYTNDEVNTSDGY